MTSTLIIVESPAKAKKIQALLGSSYDVRSSVGHIRDLPDREMGVDLQSYHPQYQVSEGKQSVVSKLGKAARSATQVVIATDADREGEAIAWHLKEALAIGEAYQRITYGQVTLQAVKQALGQPRRIDMNLVRAQEARRVLDRFIGYIVSPALSERAGTPLSAGRVQSVATRMVVERERQIFNFTPRSYYEPVFRPESHPEVEAHLVLDGWAGPEDKHLYDAAIAKQFAGTTAAALVQAVGKTRTVNPRPPFVTVSLQEVAGKRFGMGSATVMRAAQKLYDNGHITYHRTDNPNLSGEGFQEIIQYLSSQSLAHAQTQPTFSANTDAEQAHEAIRPSDVSVAYAGADEEEQRLYKLIRERALLSCMPPGQDELTQLMFEDRHLYATHEGTNAKARFVARGRVMREAGWRQYATLDPVETKDTPLPLLTKGKVYPGSTEVTTKQTEPANRYTQHALVKALEAAGIGRPSTYASILDNVLTRGYIEPVGDNPSSGRKKKKDNAASLAPTEYGYYIVDSLIQMQFMNYKYTRDVEATLDQVARGEKDYINIVRPVHHQITDDIDKRLGGEALVRVEPCPNCQRSLVQRRARKNREHTFWVHKRHKDGENCYQFLDDAGGVPSIPVEPEQADCPNCHQPIKRLTGKGKNGPFWVHVNRDHAAPCGVTFINDTNGAPALPEPIKKAICLLCGSPLKRLYSRKTQGHFWVHDTDEHECQHNTFPDDEGEPDFPASDA